MIEPYLFGGRNLSELVAMAGHSPAYVYDRQTIHSNIMTLRQALPKPVNIHYSLKANPLPQLISFVAPLCNGLDVTSQSELISALGASTENSLISYSGPGKTDKELVAAVTAGITIHLESENELFRIAQIAERTGITPRLSVRINPNFSIRQSGMVMGGGAQPFGIDQERVGKVLSTITNYGFSCAGLHCYVGSQILSADVIADAQEKILDMMAKLVLSSKIDNDRCVLNIGGGFGIPYSARDKPLDIDKVGTALNQQLHKLEKEVGCFTVSVETGRYIVGNAGIYIARVIDRKSSRGKTFLVVNGGLNHHLAATGNLGQVIRRNYPIRGWSATGNSCLETVSVVGPLCTPLDVLGSDVELIKLERDDYIAILQSGAYGYSASPINFLGHPPPAELFV